MRNLLRYTTDPIAVFFAAVAAAGLIVSAPATHAIVRRYHDDGTWIGMAASIALVVILEVATTGAKFAAELGRVSPAQRRALISFCVTGLTINAVSNGIHGAKLAAAQGDSGMTLLIGTVVYSALISVVIYIMLNLCAQRCAQLRAELNGGRHEVEAMIAPLRVLIEQTTQVEAEMQRLRTNLLPVETYPRTATTEALPAPAPVGDPVGYVAHMRGLGVDDADIAAQLQAQGVSGRQRARALGVAEATLRSRGW